MKLLSAAASSLLLRTAASQDCPPELTQSMTLRNADKSKTLTFHYDVVLSSLSDSRSVLCAHLESDAGGFILFGTSPTGTMQDGEGIIGIPDDAQDDPGTVMKYNFNADYPPVPMIDEHQTLMDTQVLKENGNTIVMFSKLLREGGERPILANGLNTFLYVLGTDSDLDYFSDDEVGTFSVDFGITRPPTSSFKTPAPTFGGLEVPEGIERTIPPTMGFIRRDEPVAPAPTPTAVTLDSAPVTLDSEQDAAAQGAPSGSAMIRKTIGNKMVLGSGIALWLIA